MKSKPFGQHEMTRLVQARWSQLTEADVEAAGDDRAALARTVARRYEIPVNQAKQEVRDFLRVAGPGKTPGGKRGRRAVERSGQGSGTQASLGGEPGTNPLRNKERVKSVIPGGLAGEAGSAPSRVPGESGTDPKR